MTSRVVRTSVDDSNESTVVETDSDEENDSVITLEFQMYVKLGTLPAVTLYVPSNFEK